MKSYKIHFIYAGSLVLIALTIVSAMIYMQKKELDQKNLEISTQKRENDKRVEKLDECLDLAQAAQITMNQFQDTSSNVQSYQDGKDECYSKYGQ